MNLRRAIILARIASLAGLMATGQTVSAQPPDALHALVAELHPHPSADQPKLSSISSLSPARAGQGSLVAVRGSVTHTGRETFIQDRTGALLLRESGQNSRLALGDEVEAIGVPSFDRTPSLAVQSLRRLWAGSTPLPLGIDPDRAADGIANGMLVELDAKLVGERRGADGDTRLVLQGGSQTFAATLPSKEIPSSIGLPMWPVNAELRLVGVLVLNPDSPALADAPFQLLLRSAQDVEVMRPAPWWTPEHLAWVGLGAAVAVLLGFVQWQRVRSLRLNAVLEERSRIARDIHDTLAQGFAGITLQLESAELLLCRDIEAAQGALRMALQMVRRSRTESHASIRVLRCLSRDEPLHTLLKVSTADFSGKTLRVLHRTEGSPYPTPYEITNHLFQIGMEAFANAIQHAQADEIAVLTCYTREAVKVTVSDNGRGFDPELSCGMQQGHFGLTGMRERATAIGATLTLTTAPGHGTTVTVSAPRKPGRS